MRTGQNKPWRGSRTNGQNKRWEGRRNSGHNHNPSTRTFESNGPDVRVRGSASLVAEKYLQLARDAQASGDPIAAEGSCNTPSITIAWSRPRRSNLPSSR